MKNNSFELLLKLMTPTQQAILEKLENDHADLLWEGGKAETAPLRVSIKNADGRGIAAINTRNKVLLRLEFRGKDYEAPGIISTNHLNFDKAFDLASPADVNEASRIIEVIKKRY